MKAGSETLFVNDGNPDTFWEAAVSSEENWWRLDMENFYVVSGVGVTIPEGASGDFVIEVSEDGKRWTYAGRQNAGFPAGKGAITMNPNSYGRFLRIVFKGGDIPVKVANSTSTINFKQTADYFGGMIRNMAFPQNSPNFVAPFSLGCR